MPVLGKPVLGTVFKSRDKFTNKRDPMFVLIGQERQTRYLLYTVLLKIWTGRTLRSIRKNIRHRFRGSEKVLRGIYI